MSVILYQCITLWSMCLLTEWEGRTGKYLARGHALQTEGSEVHAVWPRAKYFAVRPDLTQSISILSYDLIFYVAQKREEREGLVNKWSVSKGARVKLNNQWYQETMSLYDIQYFVWMNANAQNIKNIQPLHNQLYGSGHTNNPNIVVEIYRADN